jgi:hypothetical protein
LGNKNKEELSFGTITLYMDEQCKEHHSTHITQAVLAIRATTKSFALFSHDDIVMPINIPRIKKNVTPPRRMISNTLKLMSCKPLLLLAASIMTSELTTQ